MWAVTSYYNPARFRRRLANYKTFRANLAVPLVTVELSFDGNFELLETETQPLCRPIFRRGSTLAKRKTSQSRDQIGAVGRGKCCMD